LKTEIRIFGFSPCTLCSPWLKIFIFRFSPQLWAVVTIIFAQGQGGDDAFTIDASTMTFGAGA